MELIKNFTERQPRESLRQPPEKARNSDTWLPGDWISCGPRKIHGDTRRIDRVWMMRLLRKVLKQDCVYRLEGLCDLGNTAHFAVSAELFLDNQNKVIVVERLGNIIIGPKLFCRANNDLVR